MVDQARTVLRMGVASRDKRKAMLGIDCPDRLAWTGSNWVPGTEYIKHLVVKNVSTSTVTVKYKQTASRAFSMDFPEPIKLRPGMSAPLKVIFRPIKMQQYSDHIEIFVNDSHSFIVMIEAYTPAVHVQVPSSLDFGFVPCKELQTRALAVRNTGDVRVALSWRLDTPFSITPSSASLEPGQSMSFEVSFLPQEACSYAGNACCQLDNGSSAECSVTGIGKFPYLSIEQSSLDFGEVLVGKRVEKLIRFGNHAMVEANFSITNVDEVGQDGVFAITPMQGTLGPEEFSLLKVVYTPKHTGTFTCEHYVMSTAGGNRLALTLRGTAAGPRVTLSTRALNFGNVPCGSLASRVLYLTNHSDIAVAYDFQIDPLDSFTMSKPRGTIATQSSTHVTITFTAPSPANYWRRVPCLIKDSHPLGLDLLATTYTDKARPPPFEHRHVARYLARVGQGGAAIDFDPNLGSVPPSPVPSDVGSVDLQRPLTGCDSEPGALAQSSAGGGDGEVVPGSARPLQELPGPDSWELTFEGQDPARALTVDTDVLEFGTCSRLSTSEYQAVQVTNNTSAKITAFFSIPLWQDPAGGKPVQVFQVFPESADIKPSATATFRVAFRPPRDAAHFSQVLALCAHMKSMRNFRLVTDTHVVPPWSLPITATGNTFLHTNPEFSPKVELSHKSIMFPPCRPGERVHQTLMLVNYGDTPASFAFTNARGLAPVFQIRPTQGVIPAKSHVLVAMRFYPLDTQPRTARAVLMLNGAAANAAEITLHGCGHVPRLLFDLGGSGGLGPAVPPPTGALSSGLTMFFRPTCVGAASQRSVVLHNSSRVPVAWQWQLPSKFEGVINLAPAAGLLKGNESCSVTWSFAPAKQKVYEGRAVCLLSNPNTPPDSDNQAATRLQLKLKRLIASPEGDIQDASSLNGSMRRVPSIMGGGASQGSEQVALHVQGEGTAGALAIEPPLLDFGPVKVGHAIKRVVTLVNHSDGVLRYSLECGGRTASTITPHVTQGGAGPEAQVQAALGHQDTEEEVEEEEVDGEPEPGASPVEFCPPSSAVAPDEGLRPEELWVDEPTGAISARASKQVTVTLYPRYRKRYALTFQCRTTSIGPPSPLPAPRPPSGGTGPGAHRLPPVAAPNGTLHTSVLPAPDASLSAQPSQPPPALALVSAVTATCAVRAAAEFPMLRVTDALIDGVPKQVAWGLLGLQEVNAELATPVTPLELELSAMEDKGTLTTAAAVRALRPFTLDFGCAAAGSEELVVRLEFSNTSQLPLHWELHSSDDPDLEMENWVEPGRPRTEEEKARDFITENQIFQIKPRHGLLEAGGRGLVTLKYKPQYEGVHTIPIFLHVADGKRLCWQLHGCTVLPPVQRLLLLPAMRTFTFEPTPIGEREVPHQLYLLRNGGPSPVRYQVDVSRMQALVTEEDHGFQVMRLVSSPEGTIPPYGASPITLQFVPLEARYYSATLPVLLSDGSQELVTLMGRGFHPDDPLTPPPLPSEGDRDWARWPGFSAFPCSGLGGCRLVVPSQDSLPLGVTTPRGVLRSLVVLTNTSAYPVLYEWDLGVMGAPGSLSGGDLEISPGSGRLQPGERVVARVSFTAGLVPALLEGEVTARVYVDEEAVYGALAEAQEQANAAAAAAGMDVTDTGSVIEEVIAQHPPVGGGGGSRRLRTPRIPIHLYMTTSIVGKLQHLGVQWQQTLSTLRQQEEGGGGGPTHVELPGPQSVALTLGARVLAPHHIRSALFMAPHQVGPAQEALESGALWVPPTQVPFWRDPALREAAAGAALHLGGGSQQWGQVTLGGLPTGALQDSTSEAASPQAMGALAQQLSAALEPSVIEGGGGGPALPGSQVASPPPAEGTPLGAEGSGADMGAAGSSAGMDITFANGMAGCEDGQHVQSALSTGVGQALEAVAEEEGEEPHTPTRTPDDDQQPQPGGIAGSQAAILEGLLATAAAEAEAQEAQSSAQAGAEAEGSPASSRGAEPKAFVQPAAHQQSQPQSTPQFQSAWQPLPRLVPPSLPEPPLPTQVQAAQAATAALLQALLQEVMDPAREPQVVATLACLPKQPVPAFVQLQEGGVPAAVSQGGTINPPAAAAVPLAPVLSGEGGSSVFQPQQQAQPAVLSDGQQQQVVSSSRSTGQLAGLGGSTVLESLREEEEGEEEEFDAPPSTLAAGVTGGGSAQAHLAGSSEAAVGHQQSTGVGVEELSPEEVACILRDPVFQEFSEYVVESALLGLIQESAAGEWEPPSSQVATWAVGSCKVAHVHEL